MSHMAIGYDLVAVRTVPEFVQALGDGPYDLVCLDHDLGGHSWVPSDGNEETGYHAALALAELPIDLRPKRVIVHSFNPIGSGRILEVLDRAGVTAFRVPFGEWKLK